MEIYDIIDYISDKKFKVLNKINIIIKENASKLITEEEIYKLNTLTREYLEINKINEFIVESEDK